MMTMNRTELARKLKEKYPQYGEYNDDQLVDAFIKKFPHLGDRITQNDPGLFGKVREFFKRSQGVDDEDEATSTTSTSIPPQSSKPQWPDVFGGETPLVTPKTTPPSIQPYDWWQQQELPGKEELIKTPTTTSTSIPPQGDQWQQFSFQGQSVPPEEQYPTTTTTSAQPQLNMIQPEAVPKPEQKNDVMDDVQRGIDIARNIRNGLRSQYMTMPSLNYQSQPEYGAVIEQQMTAPTVMPQEVSQPILPQQPKEPVPGSTTTTSIAPQSNIQQEQPSMGQQNELLPPGWTLTPEGMMQPGEMQPQASMIEPKLTQQIPPMPQPIEYPKVLDQFAHETLAQLPAIGKQAVNIERSFTGLVDFLYPGKATPEFIETAHDYWRKLSNKLDKKQEQLMPKLPENISDDPAGHIVSAIPSALTMIGEASGLGTIHPSLPLLLFGNDAYWAVKDAARAQAIAKGEDPVKAEKEITPYAFAAALVTIGLLPTIQKAIGGTRKKIIQEALKKLTNTSNMKAIAANPRASIITIGNKLKEPFQEILKDFSILTAVGTAQKGIEYAGGLTQDFWKDALSPKAALNNVVTALGFYLYGKPLSKRAASQLKQRLQENLNEPLSTFAPPIRDAFWGNVYREYLKTKDLSQAINNTVKKASIINEIMRQQEQGGINAETIRKDEGQVLPRVLPPGDIRPDASGKGEGGAYLQLPASRSPGDQELRPKETTEAPIERIGGAIPMPATPEQQQIPTETLLPAPEQKVRDAMSLTAVPETVSAHRQQNVPLVDRLQLLKDMFPEVATDQSRIRNLPVYPKDQPKAIPQTTETSLARTEPTLTQKIKDFMNRTNSKYLTLDNQEREGHERPIQIDDNMSIGAVSLDQLVVHPDIYQYKRRGIRQKGVTSKFRDITYDPQKAGVIMVTPSPFKGEEGKLVVLNGHHRVELAQRSGYKGKIPVALIKTSSPEQARFIAALSNIAEGQGTPFDAALLFRENGISQEDLQNKYHVSLSGKVANEGIKAAHLSDDLFRKYEFGELSDTIAAIIGELNNADQQRKAYDLITKKNLSEQQAQELISFIKHAGTRDTPVQQTLFGAHIETESNIKEFLSLTNYIKNALRKTSRVFGMTAQNKDALERLAGNVIDRAATENVSRESATALGIFDKFKHYNEISGILRHYAQKLSQAKDREAVKREAFDAVNKAITNIIETRGGGGAEDSRPTGIERIAQEAGTRTAAETAAEIFKRYNHLTDTLTAYKEGAGLSVEDAARMQQDRELLIEHFNRMGDELNANQDNIGFDYNKKLQTLADYATRIQMLSEALQAYQSGELALTLDEVQRAIKLAKEGKSDQEIRNIIKSERRKAGTKRDQESSLVQLKEEPPEIENPSEAVEDVIKRYSHFKDRADAYEKGTRLNDQEIAQLRNDNRILLDQYIKLRNELDAHPDPKGADFVQKKDTLNRYIKYTELLSEALLGNKMAKIRGQRGETSQPNKQSPAEKYQAVLDEAKNLGGKQLYKWSEVNRGEGQRTIPPEGSWIINDLETGSDKSHEIYRVERIPISDLNIPPSNSIAKQLSQEKISNYTNRLLNNEQAPPIKVVAYFTKTGELKYRIEDGYMRYFATKHAGHSDILAAVSYPYHEFLKHKSGEYLQIPLTDAIVSRPETDKTQQPLQLDQVNRARKQAPDPREILNQFKNEGWFVDAYSVKVGDLREVKSYGTSFSKTIAKLLQGEHMWVMGTPIESAADVATLAALCRNPRMETSRFVGVGNKRLVGVYFSSLRLPNISKLIPTAKTQVQFEEIALDLMRKFREAGADTIYFVHNHPSGDVRLSSHDIRAIKSMANIAKIYGLSVEGIVTNGEWKHISFNPDGITTQEATYSYKGDIDPHLIEGLLKPELTPHADRMPALKNAIGTKINSPKELLKILTALDVPENNAIIIYFNIQNKVTGAEEIPRSWLKFPSQLTQFIDGQKIGYGATAAIAVTTPTPELNHNNFNTLLIRNNTFQDVVFLNQQYPPISLFKQGKFKKHYFINQKFSTAYFFQRAQDPYIYERYATPEELQQFYNTYAKQSKTGRFTPENEPQENKISEQIPIIKEPVDEDLTDNVGLPDILFHASNAGFDKFSLEHVGSGHGGAVHGYGIYLTDKPSVAQTYLNKYIEETSRRLNANKLSAKALSEIYWNITKQVRGNETLTNEQQSRALDALDAWRKKATDFPSFLAKEPYSINMESVYESSELKNYPRIYYTALDAKPEDILIWEEKPSQQQIQRILDAMTQRYGEGGLLTDAVRNIFEYKPINVYRRQPGYNSADLVASFNTKSEAFNFINSLHDNTDYYFIKPSKSGSGGNIYKALAEILNSQKSASELLAAAGFKAMRFNTFDEHGAHQGFNFVVYQPSSVNIKDIFVAEEQAHMRTDYQDHDPLKKVMLNDFFKNVKKSLLDKIFLDIKRSDMTEAEAMFFTPFHLSERYPEIDRLLNIQLNRDEDRNILIYNLMRSPNNPKEMHPIYTLSNKDIPALAKVIVESDQKQIIYSEKQLIEKGLNADQRNAYFAWKQSMDDALNMRVKMLEDIQYIPYRNEPWAYTLKSIVSMNALDAEKKRLFEQAKQQIAEQYSLRDVQKFQDAYDQITGVTDKLNNLRKEMGKVVFYFPRTRKTGNYVIKVYRVQQPTKPLFEGEPTAEPTRTLLHLERFSNRIQGKIIEKRLQQQFSGPDIEIVASYDPKIPETSYEIASLSVIDRIIEDAISRINDTTNLDKHTLELMTDAVHDAIIKELNERGWSRHQIQRNKTRVITGYETEDIKKIFTDYMTGLAGILTKQRAALEMFNLLRDLPFKTKLYEYAKKYSQDMLRNDTSLDRLSGKMRSLAFLWYLGGNMKSVLAQLTQNYTTGMAFLNNYLKKTGQKGILRGERAYHKAMKDVIFGKLSKEESSALHDAMLRNITTDQYVREITSRMQRSYGKLNGEIITAISIPFSEMEIFNRKSAFLAMFRAARQHGISYPQAIAQAKRFVYQTHYLYGKANLPEPLRGASSASKAGRTLYTFRSFSHNYLNGLINERYKGNYDVIGRSLAMLSLLGGYKALPFIDDILDFLERKTGTPFRAQMKKMFRSVGGKILETIGTHGLPALIGADLSGSLKVDIPFLSDPNEIFGVYGNLYNNAQDALNLFLNQAYVKSIATAAPQFIGNIVKAYEGATSGVTTRSGKPLIDKHGQKIVLTPKEMTFQALGIKPERVSQSLERKRMISNIKNFYKEKRDDIYTRARFAHSTKDINSVVNDAMQYNNDVLKYGKGSIPLIDITHLVKPQFTMPKDLFLQQFITEGGE